MKKFIFAICLLYYEAAVAVQKVPLDHDVYNTWPQITDETISNDGKWLMYRIGSEKEGYTLIIKATNDSWQKIIPNGNSSIFTEDSKHIIFKTSKDSLGILEPIYDRIKWLPNVSFFKTPSEGNGQWLAFQTSSPAGDLIVMDLFSGQERRIGNVKDFFFNNIGSILLLRSVNRIDTAHINELIWITLPQFKQDTIVRTIADLSSFSFDNTGKQLVIMAIKDNATQKSTVLKYFKDGMDSGVIKVDSSVGGMAGVILNSESPYFSKDGSKIFFSILKPSQSASIGAPDSSVHVDIWRSTDDYLGSYEKGSDLRRLAVFLINKGKVTILNQEQYSSVIQLANEGDGDYALTCKVKGDMEESYWRPSARTQCYLVSLEDGSKKLFSGNLLTEPYQIRFSPTGKYVIWFDQKRKNFFLYNIAKDEIKNISRLIPAKLCEENDTPAPSVPFGIAAWLKNDTALFIYDQYDIWQVNLATNALPINLTKGIGRRNRTVLRYAFENLNNPPAISSDQVLLLTSFNQLDKSAGFFNKKMRSESAPARLFTGPFQYSYPIKAKFTGDYLIRRSNPKLYPNLFLTPDFINFRQITYLNPQKKYNWYTAELIHWKLFNGSPGEGVLYKPEDFDPQKKYPVIFYYYEKKAYTLNKFIEPVLSDGELDIPWYVSNGYLVFAPDIYYQIGYPGKSAYKSIMSAAKYLSGKPWVDTKKMGLQGHSFGGYETNYIVTQTQLFAAAAPAAGISDMISNTLSIRGLTGGSNEYSSEISQLRIGTTLWKKPELYIKNSPIFFANKVTTPLLIMHNRNDWAVQWAQAAEWFLALRRLGKKAWLLQYQNEGHVIDNKNNQLDYTIKLSQFFDHYLKNKPAPDWMINPLPISDRTKFDQK